MMTDYIESPRISYEGNYVFVRVCPVCGRFVKPDKSIKVFGPYFYDAIYEKSENATCSKCGRVAMPYEGQIEY